MLQAPFGSQRSSAEWLDLARTQLQQAHSAKQARDDRSVLASVKMAAHFAISAWLCEHPQSGWGGSPVVRLACFARADQVPPEVQKAAHVLETANPNDASLAQLGRKSGAALWCDCAELIVNHAANPTGASHGTAVRQGEAEEPSAGQPAPGEEG